VSALQSADRIVRCRCHDETWERWRELRRSQPRDPRRWSEQFKKVELQSESGW